MNAKSFLVSGLVGGVVYYLLGWLFYGIVFKSFFPAMEETTESMVLILLGCLTYGLFLAYIYNKWAQISTVKTGAIAGAIIGLFMGLISNFFNKAMMAGVTYEQFLLDVGIMIVTSAIIGAVVGALIGKLNPK